MGRDKGRREYSTTLIDIDQLTDGVSQLLVPLLSLLELQINAEATATNNNSHSVKYWYPYFWKTSLITIRKPL